MKTYVVELCNQSKSEAFIMATRLSGRRVLDQILAGESDPVKIVKAVTMTNSSKGSEFQVESDDSDSRKQMTMVVMTLNSQKSRMVM